MPRILIITGEASGDLHGANLARALKQMDPSFSIVGIGGARMRAAGVELIPNVVQLDVMGLIGPAAVKPIIQRVMRIRRVIRSEAWDLIVLIDNPGLNFHFARVAKAAGRRVLYYIAPQIWAWRPRRIRWIQRRVDHVVVILPFEAKLYQRAGVRCTFVGHPLLDEVESSYDRTELRKRFDLPEDRRLIGLLPGSRQGEIRSLLPVMLEAAARLSAAEPGMQFLLAQAPSVPDALLQECLAQSRVPVRVVHGQASEVMAVSDLLFVASGTATLQAAVVGTPMILLYATTWPTYWLARLLITVDCIGLVNLVAGRKIVPELIQQDATADRLCREAARLLQDTQVYDEMKAALRAVREALGRPGASQRAAEIVLTECRA
ncbi:MAG TPA: lipid-A-disaccharide synthase [Nitrospiraceae bacterium]|nr:lipid-A-disaccharide synthase [Nitrospiraceae bacterium]